MISIQYRSDAGHWVTVSSSFSDSVSVVIAMRAVAATWPNARIRAVDESGRIVDNL